MWVSCCGVENPHRSYADLNADRQGSNNRPGPGSAFSRTCSWMLGSMGTALLFPFFVSLKMTLPETMHDCVSVSASAHREPVARQIMATDHTKWLVLLRHSSRSCLHCSMVRKDISRSFTLTWRTGAMGFVFRWPIRTISEKTDDR